MKKNEKLVLLFREKPLPETVWSSLLSADENDLRVLLSLSLLGEADEAASLIERLDISKGELDASLKYWCGAGLIKKSRKSAKSAEPCEQDKQDKKEEKPTAAHRGGKLERGSELPSYTSEELSALIEKRRGAAEFINEAQRVIGKVFNTHEVNILMGMVDYIGFDEPSVIIILSHVYNSGNKSLRYAEKLAFELYDEGINDADTLQKYLCRLEGYEKTKAEVRAMFGMTGRALTAKEKKFLKAWIETMGFDAEVIRLAYDITVDATHEPSAPYANSILESWHAEGLMTPEAVIEAQEKKKQKAREGKAGDKSFDTDEFFAAALRRSLEEL